MSRGAKSNQEYIDLYVIAHALNDGINAAIKDCENFRPVYSEWAREDAYAKANEKACLQNALQFAEALLLYADKEGKLNPLEKEKVGFAFAAQPDLFGDGDPEFHPLVLHPGQMEKSMGRFHGNIDTQIDRQLPAADRPFTFRGTPQVDYDEAMAEASKWLKEYPSRSLALFLKEHPKMRERMRELAAPAMELRDTLDEVIDAAYRRPKRDLGDHDGTDRQNIGFYFWEAERRYKPKPAPDAAVALHAEFEAWSKAMGTRTHVYEALKPLSREDVAQLKNSKELFRKLKDGIEDLQKDGTWPQPDKETAAALTRLGYVADEVGAALETRYTKIVPSPRNITPGEANRKDCTGPARGDD